MRRSVSIALFAAALLTMAAGLFAGGEQTDTPASAAGLTVYKDPETGRLRPLPPEKLQELTSPELRKAVSLSHEGLKETAAPGGGVMVDLQGRFQSAMQARIAADGELLTDCGHAEPSAPATSPEPPKE